MQPDLYPDCTNRKAYNLFINSSIEPINNKDRSFTNMDLFPTTLASMSVEIDGDKLGLGTNLFSNKKTLLEKYGKKEFDKKINLNSKLYESEFENK
jgi:phosphoglycerol transferase